MLNRVCVAIACWFAASSVAYAQQTPENRYYFQTETACGRGTVRTFVDNAKGLDAADNAGESPKVIAFAQQTIELATTCLDGNVPPPEPVRVYLRNQMLGAYGFMLSNMSSSRDGMSALSRAFRNEARIAMDQCVEPDLLTDAAPYTNAKQFVGFALDRADKILGSAVDTPIDEFKDEYRTCGLRIGRPVKF